MIHLLLCCTTDTQLVPRQLSAVKDIGRGSYKAVGLFEDKRVIAGTVGAALLGLVGISIAGMRATEHHACEKVAEQERVMQQSWDAMHPDGFVGAGDQMRPASFDCKVQERPMKPLISYGNPSQWY